MTMAEALRVIRDKVAAPATKLGHTLLPELTNLAGRLDGTGRAARQMALPELRQIVAKLHQSIDAGSSLLTYQKASVLSREQWATWYERGYLVLPRFFGQYRLDEINNLIDTLWAERKRPDNPLVADMLFGSHGVRRTYFRDMPDRARESPYKLLDLFLEFELIREMCTEPRLCCILADLLDGDPLVCNTLNMERGTQQEFHFDTFYMPAPVENKMVATWIALEDIHPDSGPLRYYPGSHKIPPYHFSHGRLHPIAEELPLFREYIESELAQRELQPTTFAARAGDVLIWHSQLFHGGGEIVDLARTRKSLVTHYFRAKDFPATERCSIAPGRHILKRPHQKDITA